MGSVDETGHETHARGGLESEGPSTGGGTGRVSTPCTPSPSSIPAAFGAASSPVPFTSLNARVTLNFGGSDRSQAAAALRGVAVRAALRRTTTVLLEALRRAASARAALRGVAVRAALRRATTVLLEALRRAASARATLQRAAAGTTLCAYHLHWRLRLLLVIVIDVLLVLFHGGEVITVHLFIALLVIVAIGAILLVLRRRGGGVNVAGLHPPRLLGNVAVDLVIVVVLLIIFFFLVLVLLYFFSVAPFIGRRICRRFLGAIGQLLIFILILFILGDALGGSRSSSGFSFCRLSIRDGICRQLYRRLLSVTGVVIAAALHGERRIVVVAEIQFLAVADAVHCRRALREKDDLLLVVEDKVGRCLKNVLLRVERGQRVRLAIRRHVNRRLAVGASRQRNDREVEAAPRRDL